MRGHLSVEDLDSFREENVTGREKQKIERHLSECKQCREKYNLMVDLENYLQKEDYVGEMFTERVVDSLKENKNAGRRNYMIGKRRILKPVFSGILICAFVGSAFYFGSKYDAFKRNSVTEPENLKITQATGSPTAAPARNETVNILLYFPNQSAEYVVPEQRTVEKRQGEKLEEVIFRELQKGSERAGYGSVIPEGTKLISSEVKDGICYLDLSKEFVENNPGGTAFEMVLINSIVNSLTELSYIEKVQFLVEGEKREVYTHMAFNGPFERNESLIRTPENTPEAIEERIRELGNKVLAAFKNKDLQSLSLLIHPDKGVRFSPYTYVEVEKDVVISAEEMKEILDSDKLYTWGFYGGIGDPIELTFAEYLEKFVYDQDFLNADEVIYDKVFSRGNTINNVFEVYAGSHIVEYYLEGTPEYDGMDWRSLKLVFEEKDGNWYLTGVVHDQWTI